MVLELQSAGENRGKQKMREVEETWDILENLHERKPPPFSIDEYIRDLAWYLETEMFAKILVGP